MSPAAEWPVRLAVLLLFLAPLFAISISIATQCLLVASGLPIFDGSQLLGWFVICYFGGMEIGVLQMVIQDIRRRQSERSEVRRMLNEKTPDSHSLDSSPDSSSPNVTPS